MRDGRGPPGQGSNSTLVGDFNERVLLTTLRRDGPASKTELARRAGLTKNAAGVIVRKLEESGLVRPLGKRYGGRGQPATLIELDPSGAYAIGVRLDRDLVECVLVDIRGVILDRTHVDDLPDPVTATNLIARDVARFSASLGDSRRRIAGIGLATPYNLGSWLKELGLPELKFKAWDRFNIKAALAANTDLPILVENDGTAAAVGELDQGLGREIASFLYVFIGPAIGGGIVLNGDYLRGTRRNAGDIAVIPVTPSRLVGARREKAYEPLLSRASLRSLVVHLGRAGVAVSSQAALAAAIAAHPALFQEWRDDAVDALIAPVLAAVHLLDLDTVVLDGDLDPASLDGFVSALGDALAGAVSESREAPRVLRGSLGKDAAAVGAASLPLHASFSPLPTVLTGGTRDHWLRRAS